MKWIKDRRKQLGLSQEDMASMLQVLGYDVGRSTIGHWESGHVAPPMGNPDFVRQFAKVLKMDIVTVLQLSGFSIPISHSEISERIARLLDTMPDDKQQLALRLVEQLVE